MRSSGLMVIACGALVVSIGAIVLAAGPAKVQRPAWEYKVVAGPQYPDNYDAGPGKMNDEGAEGWELVCVDPPPGSTSRNSNRYFFYKRPK